MRVWLGGLLSLTIVMVATADGADVRELIGKLKSPDAEVRRTAAKDLAELGPEAVTAVPELKKALKDKDLFVRRFAAEALGAIGTGASSAANDLGKMLMSDSKKEAQLAAAIALGKIGPSGVKALTSAVKDPSKDGAVRRKAAQSLALIGEEARSSVTVLASVLKGKVKNKKGKFNDDDIRIDVAIALGAIATSEDKAAVEALRAVSEGKQRNKELKKAAGEALRKLTGEEPKKKNKKKT
jgi:HEAT repeat protein